MRTLPPARALAIAVTLTASAISSSGCFSLAPESAESLRGEEPLLVLAGAIYDGKGGAPIENGAILVHEGRILAIGRKSEVELPSVARVVLAEGNTVVPGFVEAGARVLCDRRAAQVLAGLRHLVAGGATSVVAVAGPRPLAEALSEWVAHHPGAWPRVVAGGADRVRSEAGADLCGAPEPPPPLAVLEEKLAAGEAPERAVAEVTLEAAERAGIEAQVGSLEPGKLADLAVLEGRLGADVPPSKEARLAEVLVGGEVTRRAAELPPSPDERSALSRAFFLTVLTRPSLWW